MRVASALIRLKAADLDLYHNVDEVIYGIIDEVIAVAAAENISIGRDDIYREIKEVMDPSKSGEHLTSMLQDVLAKRRTEIAFINGAIVKTAIKYGIPVPYNTLLTHLISMIESTYDNRVEFVHP